MAQGRRITVDMLDESLRDAIMGNASIIPINTISDIPSSNTGKMYRVLTGAEKHNIYTWDADVKRYVLIGADDRDIRWTDIMEKPTKFAPSPHTHAESEIVGLDKYTKEETNALLALRALASHVHAMDDVAGLIEALNAKVGKVEGKDLSTNDFTDNLKGKLESISDSASVSYDAMLEALNAHRNDSSIHLTEAELANIGLVQSKADKSYVDTQLASKAPLSTFNGHTGNSTIHVTQAEKDAWNGKSTFDGDYGKLTNVPSTFTPSTHTHSYNDLTDKPVIKSYSVEVSETEPTSADMWYKVIG